MFMSIEQSKHMGVTQFNTLWVSNINKLCKIMAMHEIRYLKGCILNSLLLFLRIYVPGAKCQKHFLWHLHHIHYLQKSSPWLHRETEPETQLKIEVLWKKFLSALGKDQNSYGACYTHTKKQNIRNIKTEIWGSPGFPHNRGPVGVKFRPAAWHWKSNIRQMKWQQMT